MLVDAGVFVARFPRPLDAVEMARLDALLEDAEGLLRAEFARAGRDFNEELGIYPDWLPLTARRVIMSMVSAVILVGVNAGARMVSSTTGTVSDSITFANVSATDWGQPVLTEDHRRALGLTQLFPEPCITVPLRWPEVEYGDR